MVNFNFGMVLRLPGVPEDDFSIPVEKHPRFPPGKTVHHIGTSTDDGGRLYVNGKLVINDWVDHAETPHSAEVELQAGKKYHTSNSTSTVALRAWCMCTDDTDLEELDLHDKIAARNDAVILVLGTSPAISREELDRAEIELPQIQRDLIAEVASVNPNIIVVLVNGGPRTCFQERRRKAKGIVESRRGIWRSGNCRCPVLGEINPGPKF